jgi:hypothetical protein
MKSITFLLAVVIGSGIMRQGTRQGPESPTTKGWLRPLTSALRAAASAIVPMPCRVSRYRNCTCSRASRLRGLCAFFVSYALHGVLWEC